MRFERGGDIKKTLSIGNAANPIEIIDLYAASDDVPIEYRTSPDSINIKQREALTILSGIEISQVRDWQNRFLIGVYTGETEKLPNGGDMRKFTVEKIGDYAGYYISYYQRTYKLPKE